MSWHIVSDVYKAKLGSPTRKAIAAKLADWADDDGCGIFPSVQRIADETETSVRTVQYTLGTFVSEGLLVKVREGGKGPRSTTEYRFDLTALAALPRTRQADGEKGATVAPLADDVRVQRTTKRVQPSAPKGATVAPEPKREPKREPEREAQTLLSLADCNIPSDQMVAWVHLQFQPVKKGASLADIITRSSERFRKLKGGTARTLKAWQSEWEHWWSGERETCRKTQATAPQGIRRERLMRALSMYLKGIAFDTDLGHPPADRAEAIAWLADLERSEAEFVTEFRSSRPPSPPASTAATEQGAAASCA